MLDIYLKLQLHWLQPKMMAFGLTDIQISHLVESIEAISDEKYWIVLRFSKSFHFQNVYENLTTTIFEALMTKHFFIVYVAAPLAAVLVAHCCRMSRYQTLKSGWIFKAIETYLVFVHSASEVSVMKLDGMSSSVLWRAVSNICLKFLFSRLEDNVCRPGTKNEMFSWA